MLDPSRAWRKHDRHMEFWQIESYCVPLLQARLIEAPRCYSDSRTCYLCKPRSDRRQSYGDVMWLGSITFRSLHSFKQQLKNWNSRRNTQKCCTDRERWFEHQTWRGKKTLVNVLGWSYKVSHHSEYQAAHKHATRRNGPPRVPSRHMPNPKEASLVR